MKNLLLIPIAAKIVEHNGAPQKQKRKHRLAKRDKRQPHESFVENSAAKKLVVWRVNISAFKPDKTFACNISWLVRARSAEEAMRDEYVITCFAKTLKKHPSAKMVVHRFK
jgi:hypothetical protein